MWVIPLFANGTIAFDIHKYSLFYILQNMVSKSPKEHEGSCRLAFLQRPHGAPRGLLMHYALYKIAQRPSHGYEILQDIESRTEGAWRPGAGSIYPMLKKMVDEGLITDEQSGKGKVDHRTYHITKKGLEHVRMGKSFFANFGQRWGSMRRIFIEMLEPEDVGKFLVDGSKTQFQIAQEALESKLDNLDSSEARFILKEYALNLERQLDWANSTLNKVGEEKLRPVQTVRKTREHVSK